MESGSTPDRQRKWPLPWLLRVLRTVFVTYLLMVVLVWWFQERLIFQPTRDVAREPSAVALAFEDVWLTVADGERVHGWWVPHPKARGTVLYCHGNAGNIGDRVGALKWLHGFALNVLIFDYRGYGRSDGKPSEQNTYADVRAALAELGRRGVPNGETVLYGRSLGTGVATHAAGETDDAAGFAGVVLDSPFTTLADVGAHHYPWLPVRLLIRHQYPLMERLIRVKCPVLLLHGEDDAIIPIEHSEQIHAAHEHTTFVRLRGGHNAAMQGRGADEAFAVFLDRTLPR